MFGYQNNAQTHSPFSTVFCPTSQFDFSKQGNEHRNGRTNQTLEHFVKTANPRFEFYPHCNLLAGVLERVATGEIKRLLIQLPPRHSKSEMVSRLFSAYYLKKNPHHFVGLNSYSAELAYTLSRASRENFQRCGGIVKDDVAAVKHWETPQGGGMWAAGVGGSITGKGFNLGIIDDPLKNSEEAGQRSSAKNKRSGIRRPFTPAPNLTRQ